MCNQNLDKKEFPWRLIDILSICNFRLNSYQKVRGSAQTGEVPSTYRCYKCNKMGHWIKNCPLNAHHDSTHTEVKRSTGIPRSFIDGMQFFLFFCIFHPIFFHLNCFLPYSQICSRKFDRFGASQFATDREKAGNSRWPHLQHMQGFIHGRRHDSMLWQLILRWM